MSICERKIRVYRIEISSRAVKDLKRLPVSARTRIEAAIAELGNDPRPHGCVKLTGHENTWRVRVGDYRVSIRSRTML